MCRIQNIKVLTIVTCAEGREQIFVLGRGQRTKGGQGEMRNQGV